MSDTDKFMQEVIHNGPTVQMVRGLTSVQQGQRDLEAKLPRNLWDPKLPPATVNTYDDEFNDQSLSSAWTEFDPNNRMTVEELKYGLRMTKVSVAAHDLNGIYKTLPAGNFSMFTRCAILGPAAVPYDFCGLTLWEDPTNTTKKIYTYGLRKYLASSAVEIFSTEWTNYTTISAFTYMSPITQGVESVYLRLRRNGTNYYGEYSTQGMAWNSFNVGVAVTLSFTPTAFGLHSDCINVSADEKFHFDFFRYLGSDVGFNAVLEGNRM